MSDDSPAEGAKNRNERRQVRSFVRREGRLTPGQQRALDDLWPKFGIDGGTDPLDFRKLFGRDAPVWLEIGFGNGDALLEMATGHPEHDWLGIEVHRPGVGRLLRGLEAREIDNVRVLRDDAVEVLKNRIPDTSLAGVCLFFPDPWPKKRHHKRRILQPGFAALVRNRLQPGGLFHFATDWEEYAGWTLRVLEQTPGLENLAGPGRFSPRPAERPLTRFEHRGVDLGHGVWDLWLRRSG
ncbi:MAG: tRNA (guanosine(46)-N7)-methyltransferase TrmB [Pseudomonadota bacterium]|nr:tRNA (guanosine(46)-N7)-methyltransferase TrmB [Pseudomonadota bacterium]